MMSQSDPPGSYWPKDFDWKLSWPKDNPWNISAAEIIKDQGGEASTDNAGTQQGNTGGNQAAGSSTK